MHELYELKEMLMRELQEYARKGEMSAGSLEVVDKLTHTIKNLCKIIEAYEEEEYSEQSGGSYYRRGGSSRESYYRREGGSSNGRGSNARRDSRGRYSREGYSRANDEMIEELRELMEEAPDEKTRSEIKKLIGRLEE